MFQPSAKTALCWTFCKFGNWETKEGKRDVDIVDCQNYKCSELDAKTKNELTYFCIVGDLWKYFHVLTCIKFLGFGHYLGCVTCIYFCCISWIGARRSASRSKVRGWAAAWLIGWRAVRSEIIFAVFPLVFICCEFPFIFVSNSETCQVRSAILSVFFFLPSVLSYFSKGDFFNFWLSSCDTGVLSLWWFMHTFLYFYKM